MAITAELESSPAPVFLLFLCPENTNLCYPWSAQLLDFIFIRIFMMLMLLRVRCRNDEFRSNEGESESAIFHDQFQFTNNTADTVTIAAIKQRVCERRLAITPQRYNKWLRAQRCTQKMRMPPPAIEDLLRPIWREWTILPLFCAQF